MSTNKVCDGTDDRANWDRATWAANEVPHPDLDTLVRMTDLEFGASWTRHRYGITFRTPAQREADEVTYTAAWAERDAVRAENAFWDAHCAA